MWHPQPPNASHIDEPDLVSDCASGHPNTRRFPHGEPPYTTTYSEQEQQQQQWKSGKEACVKGYSGDSGSNLYDSCRTDSGFLSGANIVSDQLLSDEITSSRKSRDLSALQQEPTALMRLDSGVDVGLNEQLSSLSLKHSCNDLNNLSLSKSQSQDSTTPLTNINVLPSPTTSPPSSPQQQQCPPEQLYTAHPWDLYFQQDEDGDTQLHIAIIQEFIEVVYSLILMVPHPGYLDIPNDVCQTPLHLAVLTHQPRIVRRLIVAGAKVDVRNRDGNTALHLACETGDMECVQALTVPITVQEAHNASLQYANYHQQVPQDLEERNYDGQMCVHLAAQNGHVDVLRHLQWFGANINAKEAKSGRTVLHYAIERCRPLVARFLLEECTIQLETPTYAGYTAYQLAACINSAMARQLADRGALPHELPEDSDSDSDYSDDEQMYQKPSDDNFTGFRLNGQPIDISA